jgi:hypothetical protein
MKRLRRAVVCIGLLAAFAPAGANAATTNFFSTDGLGPVGAGVFGPASIYPSSIQVEGLQGPLTKVTATMIDFGSGKGDDVDMLLVSPEGDEVMLMSDACGSGNFGNNTWTFDDDAPGPLPDNGPCASNQAASFQPVNYVGSSPEPDQFGAGGGIAPPYAEELSTFIGTDPNGFWDLFVFDDDESTVGFEIGGWALTLTTEPPATAPVVTPVTTVVTQPAVPGPPAPAAHAKRTGKRAAAMAKCKLKKTKAKRVKCRARARKLPI